MVSFVYLFTVFPVIPLHMQKYSKSFKELFQKLHTAEKIIIGARIRDGKRM